jgi:two-component system chemotaxis sensor kinase CheA
MTSTDEEFYQKLLATFKGEAAEHLQAITDGVMALEKGAAAGARPDLIETIYREAHSLKGAARAVNLREIETLCQPLESLLSVWKQKSTPPTTEIFDLIHQTVTVLEDLVSQAGNGATAAQRDSANEMAKTLTRALAAAAEAPPPSQATPSSQSTPPPRPLAAVPSAPGPAAVPPSPASPSQASPSQETPPECRPYLQVEARPDPTPAAVHDKPFLTDTIRVAAAKLDALLLEAEEFIAAKLIAGQRSAELREVVGEFPGWQKQWGRVQPLLRELKRHAAGGNGQVPEQWLRTIQRLTEFLEWNAGLMAHLEQKLAPMLRAAEQDARMIGGLVDNLLSDVKKVLMLPFSTLLETFPRLVRELAREQGKEVDFSLSGGEVEIDRRILQEMKDPLLHLVRNSLDHGLETPDERQRRGKPTPGRLSITIAQKDSGKVEIAVADDGRGLDPDKIKAAAVKKGIITPVEAEALTPAEARLLIFRSGVSTSPLITTISGRGLGMAIVQEKVEKLGGSIQVESETGAGTVFRLILPLTLATFRGTLIQVGQRLFVIPTVHLERVVRVKKEEIKTVENRETFLLNGQPLALVSLAAILGLPAAEAAAGANGFLTVLVLSMNNRRLGFSVGGVLNEQEVLVKNLGSQLLRVPNIAGATVLGSGAVVPILNVADLIQSATKKAPGPTLAADSPKAPAAPAARSILVAEDSITARTLLKNILELAGYQVQTAVDGLEAFTLLQRRPFDLVVSDVEMPRMNGFELTARIRADKQLAELPVILVTALESPEDKKRGIEVGANAYLVKSSFDQGNLLTIIQQLI